MNKVAIQGQRASYHHQAAKQFFDDDLEILSCDTFKSVFECLQNEDADYALVAIENSLYGSINDVYDLLLKNKFWISGEVYLRIEHCLIGLPGAEMSKIKEVHSQIMALDQCKDWLETNLPNAKHIEEHDTTASVEMVKKWADPTKSAIASEQAAKLHGMKILAKNVEDHHQNYTRFVVVQKSADTKAKTTKTSLVLSTRGDTKAGSLYQALGCFANRNINLSMLHSRPIVGKAWHYLFYIDVESGMKDTNLIEALKDLDNLHCEIIILGSYLAAKA